MPQLLDGEVSSQVNSIFKELDASVDLLFFEKKENCQYCEQNEQLLQEIAALSEKVSYKKFIFEIDTTEVARFKVPNAPFLIVGEKIGEEIVDHGIYFAGIPAGHEFTSLINAILLVSTRKVQLNHKTQKIIQALQNPVEIQVFTTPTCPYCPQAVIMAHQFAMLNSNITATMVNAVEFQSEAAKLGVQGVPHTTINNGMGTLIGIEPEEALVDEILKVVGNQGG